MSSPQRLAYSMITEVGRLGCELAPCPQAPLRTSTSYPARRRKQRDQESKLPLCAKEARPAGGGHRVAGAFLLRGQEAGARPHLGPVSCREPMLSAQLALPVCRIQDSRDGLKPHDGYERRMHSPGPRGLLTQTRVLSCLPMPHCCVEMSSLWASHPGQLTGCTG